MNSPHELILARVADLHDRFQLALSDDDHAMQALTLEELAVLVAILRDLRDEQTRRIIQATRARLELEAAT